MLFISPPFGNYIFLPYTKSIKGSYTLEPRTGLFSELQTSCTSDSDPLCRCNTAVVVAA